MPARDGNTAKAPDSMAAAWPGMLAQLRLSSSRMLGWGMFLGVCGALAAAVGVSAREQTLFFVAAIASLAGWICVAVGVTRLAAKADSAYALWVRTQYRQHLREQPEPLSAPKSS